MVWRSRVLVRTRLERYAVGLLSRGKRLVLVRHAVVGWVRRRLESWRWWREGLGEI
jgi:hypothetical protein